MVLPSFINIPNQGCENGSSRPSLIPVIAVSLLVGCQLQNLTGSGTSSATKTAVQTPANEQTATAAVTPAVTASASSESNTLVLWLPPNSIRQAALLWEFTSKIVWMPSKKNIRI